MTTHELTTPNGTLRSAPLPVDLLETDDALLLVADLPGVKAEDLDIQLEADRLTLTATRQEPAPAAGEEVVPTPLFRDLGAVRWERSFRLRTPVDADGITATLDQGVLQLTLPKAEAVRPRTIAVQTA